MIDADRSALLLIDLQNDFMHPDGAYARGGVVAPAIAQLPARLRPLVDAARAARVPVISAQFTLPELDGEPMISEHLRRLRPFLRSGDFRQGSWGHALVDDLAPADVVVDKVAYSAFAMSSLDWVLRHLGTSSLIVGGILTNGGVASTVRDAHVRDLSCTLLTDGTAALDARVHEGALLSLSAGVVTLATCAEATTALSENAS